MHTIWEFFLETVPGAIVERTLIGYLARAPGSILASPSGEIPKENPEGTLEGTFGLFCKIPPEAVSTDTCS